MAEVYQDRQVYSLFEISQSLKKTISEKFPYAFWIKAEMIKLNHYRHSGHCYPDLAEKENGRVIAQTRATLWSSDYLQINNKFLNTLKEPLKDGIKILFLARINYDPVYGLSLRILDIDPSFTLGDIEKEKNDTIKRLKEEDLFDKNKKLPFPLLPKRIAIISVETSKGYADFMKVLSTNPYGYKFILKLFPSLLQGEKAITSIKTQLNNIKKEIENFDVVAIIRGGGGDVGLSCYNDYSLSAAVAGFPIPVITGIGHATNETVVEMIAYQNAITPTKIAEVLIEKFHNFSYPVQEAQRIISERSRRMIKDAGKQLKIISRIFKAESRHLLLKNEGEIRKAIQILSGESKYLIAGNKKTIKEIPLLIKKNSRTYILNEKNKIADNKTAIDKNLKLYFRTSKQEIEAVEKTIDILNPFNLLQRGYSLTLKNGKIVKSIDEVKKGDIIETMLANGTISSEVIKKELKP